MTNKNPPGRAGDLLVALSLAAGVLAGLALLRRLVAPKASNPLSEADATPGTALITGASSGIGAAFARQLAARGYHLILVARREDRLAALAMELQTRHGICVEPLAADLSQIADIERVAERIVELERLHVLINNAGFGTPGQFAELNPDRQLDMINVHIVAAVRLCRAALPGMISRGQGTIINVSSMAGLLAVPGSTTYSASKAYVNIFSEALQAELAGTRVKVQALCPGFTHTEFHSRPDHAGFSPSWIPAPLWMQPEDVAAQSLEALGRGEVIFIPGFKNRLLAVVARHTPTRLVQLRSAASVRQAAGRSDGLNPQGQAARKLE